MATLKDIAREARVSVTTVSNVLNNKPSRVSDGLKKKIEAIIVRENYIPSMTARNLASRTSLIIGVINHSVTFGRDGSIADPFHNIFVGSIERASRKKGYFAMVRTAESTEEVTAVCRSWNLAGVILVGLFRDEFFEAVRNIGIPYVLIDSYIDLPEVCNVGLEDKKGGYLAARHLLENGHRAIAFVSPKIRENGVEEQRLLGYKQALAEFGVPFDPSLLFQQEISVSEGTKLGHLLSEREHITGIFASADILAAGIAAGLRDRGKEAPLHKSIVGFDDSYVCRLTFPRLSTIHQDINKKGEIATEMIVAKLTGKTIKENKLVLPVRLLERESVRSIHCSAD